MTKALGRKIAADTDWLVCASCRGKRLARNLKACPECGHHHRLTAGERIAVRRFCGTTRDRRRWPPTR
ncbi:MAG TPA: hypothetical protein VJT49_16005 [Amycolatopsis sp.]|uniref:hypothetical protein n=1 Tax=Amycolatopsis sp. TaxID=37632 RepID=UPI002B495549|nr:hypothetical protein [Amycolatopsis sp.]HKS46583.1 hypothetical protein [Amycolatopsis sp.]